MQMRHGGVQVGEGGALMFSVGYSGGRAGEKRGLGGRLVELGVEIVVGFGRMASPRRSARGSLERATYCLRIEVENNAI